MEEYLTPTKFIDFDTPAVRRFAEDRAAAGATEIEKAIALYYAVRDEVRYDPYSFSLEAETYPASVTLANGYGFCVPKAILLAALARAIGIPAAVGFADVRNHLSSEKLRAVMNGNDEFVWHGYTGLYLEDRWVKATPTFDRVLCEKFGVKTLEFDGRTDAMMHPFDSAGKKHMEYTADHGLFADFPSERAFAIYRATYPEAALILGKSHGRFETEAPLAN